MSDKCDYPGCNEPATIRCGTIGCNHHVCEIHGNGSVEISPEECVPICWGCDGKGWGTKRPRMSPEERLIHRVAIDMSKRGLSPEDVFGER